MMFNYKKFIKWVRLGVKTWLTIRGNCSANPVPIVFVYKTRYKYLSQVQSAPPVPMPAGIVSTSDIIHL